jgi:hypothetical protein
MKINIRKKWAVAPMLLVVFNNEDPTCGLIWKRTSFSRPMIQKFLDQMLKEKRIKYIKKGAKKVIIPLEVLKKNVIGYDILEVNKDGKYRIFGRDDDDQLLTKKA